MSEASEGLAMAGSNRMWAVSIEVDNRQRFLFETDKLREMLGASTIMRQLIQEAETRASGTQVCVFQPASGEVRAWSGNRSALLSFAWQLKEWLAARGVEHSIGLIETHARHFTEWTDRRHSAGDREVEREPRCPDLTWIHQRLSAETRRQKDAKPGYDARPVCSLFAPCQIEGWDFANQWDPDETKEPRRGLRSDRARAKFVAWECEKKDFYARNLERPVRDRLSDLGEHVPIERPITFDDLADQLDSPDETDRYIAFVCGDADGLGRFISQVPWNDAQWQDAAILSNGAQPKAPWQVNHAFSSGLDVVFQKAFARAVAETVVPDKSAAARVVKEGRLFLPLLPQLLGGDDLWIVARKEVALPLAVRFAEHVQQMVAEFKPVRVAAAMLDEAPVLTLSQGAVFAKAGYPAHAMVRQAEWLLGQAEARRRGQPWLPRPADEARLNWHPIESSLAESVEADDGMLEDGVTVFVKRQGRLLRRPYVLTAPLTGGFGGPIMPAVPGSNARCGGVPIILAARRRAPARVPA